MQDWTVRAVGYKDWLLVRAVGYKDSLLGPSCRLKSDPEVNLGWSFSSVSVKVCLYLKTHVLLYIYVYIYNSKTLYLLEDTAHYAWASSKKRPIYAVLAHFRPFWCSVVTLVTFNRFGLVVAMSIYVCIYMFPFHVIFFEASHWPSDHMIT